MQNADDRNDLAESSVNDDVRADEIEPMRFRQLDCLVAELGMLADDIKGFLQFVLIDDELILAPCFAGVPQNVDEILLRKRREFEAKFRGGHQGQSAYRCACPAERSASWCAAARRCTQCPRRDRAASRPWRRPP